MTSMGPEEKQKEKPTNMLQWNLTFSAYNMYVGLCIEVMIIIEILVMSTECVPLYV